MAEKWFSLSTVLVSDRLMMIYLILGVLFLLAMVLVVFGKNTLKRRLSSASVQLPVVVMQRKKLALNINLLYLCINQKPVYIIDSPHGLLQVKLDESHEKMSA